MTTAIRRMSEYDLSFADRLRAGAGWNQTLADWRRLLRYEPNGCFVAEQDRELAGTASTTRYGMELAWIGMLLVHPERRGSGIGTALVSHCLNYLQGKGVRCVKLDATPQARPIYERLGFRQEWTLQRWEVSRLQSIPSSHAALCRPWTGSQIIGELDAQAFGADRKDFLEALCRDSHRACLQLESGQLHGFGFVRAGARAAYLGPLIARGDAEVLVRALLSSIPGQRVYWDLPDHQPAAAELARSLGFVPQRKLIRMVYGRSDVACRPDLVFAIGSPETG